MNKLPPVVVIAGPTASGKSALAMALSRLTPSTIVNADASQCYADLRIVTARPSPEDEAEVPHALFGHVDGALAYNAAAWAEDAKVAIADAQIAGRLPILVGGTGMYIRTLLDGIAPVPEIDPHVRAGVRSLSVAEAHAALQSEDAVAAARLSPTDTTRVARALEVVRSTGRTLADWQAEKAGGIGDRVRVEGLVLLPPRESLNRRIDARFETIFEFAQDEVATLLARCLDRRLPVMRAIGIAAIAAYQHGALDRCAAIAAGGLATRQYAKRQYTWFRNQAPSSWPRELAQVDDQSVGLLVTKLRYSALTC